MGKGKKSSRKGKKAWRANISTKDFDDYIQKSSREERSGGGSLGALPNERLFFVDKSSDSSIAKKTAKHKDKMLFSDCILERTSLIPCLPNVLKRKIKSNTAQSVKAKLPQHQGAETQEKSAGHIFNIWGYEDKNSNGHGNNTQKVQQKRVGSAHCLTVAVEVDAPGCSYNPSFEDHQEALGLAVAQEMQKVYQKELEPLPVPRTVPGAVVDEEDLYFLDVGDNADESEHEETREGVYEWSRPIKVKKHTRADLNKKKRVKEQSRLEEQSRKRAKVQRDVLRLSEITREIENEEDNKHREWLRRTISKQEKLAQGPPHLGKYKFKPQPIQVHLSEEISGSLRKVKGCCTLARERYNSLQKRGLLEPRLPVKRRALKKRVHYEQGTKGQKEREMHAAMEAYRTASRQGLEIKKV